MTSYNLPLYTGTQRTRDVRIAGPLDAVINIGGHLHERTPFVELMQHTESKAPTGILFARVDEQGMKTSTQLSYIVSKYAEGQAMQRVQTVDDITLLRYPKIQPFRVKLFTIPAYSGPIPHFRSIRYHTEAVTERQLREGKKRFVLFGDTPDGAFAQALAPYFPVFCYEGKTTVITYVSFPTWRASHNWLNQLLPPELEIYQSVYLPYESTLESSPQKRTVQAPSIFEH